jgi:hypothetical protein
VEDSDQTFKDCYPSTRLNVESYKKNSDLNQYPLNQEQWNNVSSGSTIFIGREVAEDRVLFFVAATPEVANKTGIVSACGDSLGVDQANRGGFITLVKIHSLEELSVP